MPEISQSYRPSKGFLKPKKLNENSNDNSAYTENTGMKMAVLITVLGMCIGNMFAAKRMRVAKAPRGFHSKDNKPDSSSFKNNYSSKSSDNYTNKAEQEAFERRYKEYHYTKGQQQNTRAAYDRMRQQRGQSINSIPTYISANLLRLNMPVNEIPTQMKLKEAFRKFAMDNHPDRVDSDDPLKEVKELNFKLANEAFRDTMEYLELNQLP